MMSCVKSNYSWDVKIDVNDGVIFLNKREADENQGEINILNYDTVSETDIKFQPTDNDGVNGIKKLMKESR